MASNFINFGANEFKLWLNVIIMLLHDLTLDEPGKTINPIYE